MTWTPDRKAKNIRGEQYMYLLMALILTKKHGKDNGTYKSLRVGSDEDYMRARTFRLYDEGDYCTLIERKSGRSYSSEITEVQMRGFIIEKDNEISPTIREMADNLGYPKHHRFQPI